MAFSHLGVAPIRCLSHLSQPSRKDHWFRLHQLRRYRPGEQTFRKWLNDRKGRILSYDDLTHYQQIVAALAETRRLMNDIDEAIKEHGVWPLTMVSSIGN